MAIKRYIIKTHTEEWYKFRTVGISNPAFGTYEGGIGASENGVILGLNPYRPTLMELYHHKVGSEIPMKMQNESMFHGLMLEDYVADLWQYWDGHPEGYMNNKVDNMKKRSMQRVNGYLVNDKYPWLFASLDRMMNKGQTMLLRGEIMQQPCPLECKNISHYASKMWEAGIPIYYIAQVNQQMLITETKYCEIAILKDGRKFEVIPMERSEKICKAIIESTYEFWNTVLVARKAFKEKRLAERAGKYEAAREHEAIIQRYEPLPDDNEGYKEYFSEKFAKESSVMSGDDESYTQTRQIVVINAIQNELKKRKTGLVNSMTNKLVTNSVEKMDFGKEGYVTYKKKKNAKRYSLYNGLRHKPTADFAHQQMSRLDLSGIYF